MNLGDLARAAYFAFVDVAREICDGHKAALIANVNAVGIRDFKQALFEKGGGAVRNETIL